MAEKSAARSLRVDLAEAADEPLRRIVAVVDAMAVRGAADDLIAPLRPRLAEIGAPRPVNFCRLLFMPFDPVIVPARTWRRSALGIPRTALMPMANVLRESSEVLAAQEARLVQAGHADAVTVLAFGDVIWPEAAGRLARAVPPADWADNTGLALPDFAALADAIGTVLMQAPALMRLAGTPPADPAEYEAAVAAQVAAAAAHCAGRALPMATLAAILLAHTRNAERVMVVLQRCEGQAGHAMRAAALEFTLGSLMTATAGGSLGQAARRLGRAAALLADLEATCGGRGADIGRLQEVRRTLDQHCRRRAEALVRQASAATGEPHDIEAFARDALRFARVSRALGGAREDRLMHDVLAGLSAAGGGLQHVQHARLVEILLGADAAESFLDQHRRPVAH